MLFSTLFAYFISVKAGLNIVAGISTQQLELRNTLYLGLLPPPPAVFQGLPVQGFVRVT